MSPVDPARPPGTPQVAAEAEEKIAAAYEACDRIGQLVGTLAQESADARLAFLAAVARDLAAGRLDAIRASEQFRRWRGEETAREERRADLDLLLGDLDQYRQGLRAENAEAVERWLTAKIAALLAEYNSESAHCRTQQKRIQQLQAELDSLRAPARRAHPPNTTET